MRGKRLFILILSRYFIRVNPCPKKFGVCRGALLRARPEFGAKGNESLFLTLGTPKSRHFLTCVLLCPMLFYDLFTLGISNFRHFRHCVYFHLCLN